MKKLISIILALSMTLGYAASAEENKVTVLLDGREVLFPDAQPFVDKRDRTLVPIRFVSEKMGAEVSWEQDERTVVIKKDKDTVRYTIGSMKAALNNDTIVFDTFGIIKDDRTLVPIRFISEMLACDVDWNPETKTVTIISPGEAVKFPEPKITVNFPQSESDKRLLWITLDNYRDFERDCPNYEFKIEFTAPTQFNAFEQDEGAINGWQKYSRVNFTKLTNTGSTILTITRAYYATREDKKAFTPKDGDNISFKLTVLRKCSGEQREYMYNETLKMPYSLIDVGE
ncbi:MAG: copper amine oxidase N-terminal domain-containing protein [Clostridiales bacterium]|nr:copper amine oxidase N-terminal domain-containing protein [Clostridiales bacterium]